MDDQMQRQIFTPYFATKPAGTGLGLAIVQRIVTEHHGEYSRKFTTDMAPVLKYDYQHRTDERGPQSPFGPLTSSP
jgi:signal transduction histidine kinase